ncbi:MAG TPA: ferritin-like domain-containing protein [Vicinamibacterales bacterium]|nr:ferritin-like domain-containing protein [Vicinamibacterales bacterium]
MPEERHPLHDLFEDQIKDLYSAENQIIKALPKMAKNATNPQLRAAFERHLDETRNQAGRLEQIADELDFSPKGKKCAGMEGLLEEGKEVMSEFDEDTLDAAMIGAAQKVEHYEIAAYGTARAHAELLGYTRAARLLQQTLDEEGRTDKKLSQLAESVVNVEALQEA